VVMGDRRRLLVFIGRLVFSLLVSGMLFFIMLILIDYYFRGYVSKSMEVWAVRFMVFLIAFFITTFGFRNRLSRWIGHNR
jgi:hypothetical protein